MPRGYEQVGSPADASPSFDAFVRELRQLQGSDLQGQDQQSHGAGAQSNHAPPGGAPSLQWPGWGGGGCEAPRVQGPGVWRQAQCLVRKLPQSRHTLNPKP